MEKFRFVDGGYMFSKRKGLKKETTLIPKETPEKKLQKAKAVADAIREKFGKPKK